VSISWKLKCWILLMHGITMMKSPYIRYPSTRYQVATVADIKTTVFWHVTPCNLLDGYQHFKVNCCMLVPLQYGDSTCL